MNSKANLDIKGFLKIYDPVSMEVFVEKTNAIHYENFSIALAQNVANKGINFISEMHFGNGGTTVDPTGVITYLPTNTNVANADLYNPTYYKIVDDTNAANTVAMENTLIPCIQDAQPITSQVQAIEFIRTLTKGFIVEHVLDILYTNLFSHIPNRPLAKAYYLAELVRRMIRVEMRMEQSTNRDDVRNQRLLPTGIS